MTGKLSTRRTKQTVESGAAMLIAIFALLLISVVAIALVVSSGTDSSLAGNYRTATSSYYAGVAGLEEARGRLLGKNPNCLVNRPISPPNPNCPNVGFIPMDPANGILPKMALTDVRYILNPANGETVDPTDLSASNPYADNEYFNEFGWAVNTTNWQTVTSVSSVAGLPGPSYKWVRITPVTENALRVDVNGDGTLDKLTPLVYDPAPARLPSCPASNLTPGLFVPTSVKNCPSWLSNTAVQALAITALAVAPNGGHRLLQYIVAPLIISPDAMDPNFPAALTLDGNGVNFESPGPGTPNYYLTVQDGCSVSFPMVYSIAYTNPADFLSIQPQVNPLNRYLGASAVSSPPCAPTPSGLLSSPFPPPLPQPGFTSSLLRTGWQTPATLDAVMQDIQNSADVVINGSATGAQIASLAPGMSVNNPMTIVVNGNLQLNGRNFIGYGLLLVTGTLTYDPDASWNGIVLVVGQGVFASSGNGSGGITGTVFVAQTRNSAGNLLPGNTLGAACFGSASSCGTMGFGHGHHGFGSGYGTNPGYGIRYSSSWVSSAQGPLTYKVLSFHEIPLPN